MIKKIIKYLMDDYNRRTFIFTSFSTFVCFVYVFYNGFIGIFKQSIFNGSICVYYFLLLVLRASLLYFRKKDDERITSKVMMISFIVLIVITLSMIAPIILLVKDRRDYDLGLIPAIAMAAYTTFSITAASINMKVVKNNNNPYVKQLRLINMIYALMSITVLQSTMILANGGYSPGMSILTAGSSALIVIIIVTLIVFSFKDYLKNRKSKFFS